MESYFYTKEGIDAEILTEAIRLRTTLLSVYIACNINDLLEESGAVRANNIEVQFSKALSSSEQDEVTAIINIMGPTYDLVYRKMIKKKYVSPARITGIGILDDFSANNVYRGKTDVQIDELSTQYPDIYHTLNLGSLKAALRIFKVMPPDLNISQPEIDEFILRLEIELGIKGLGL